MTPKRVLRNEKFKTNDIEEASSTLTYMGQQDGDGDWLVVKIDESSDTNFSYASIKNNSTIKSYASAWTGRDGLNYDNYEIAV